jgi:hypothetical protein
MRMRMNWRRGGRTQSVPTGNLPFSGSCDFGFERFRIMD